MRTRHSIVLRPACLAILALSLHAAPQTISLSGEWAVALGENGKTASIHLPGSTNQARLGQPNQSKPTLDGLYRLYPYEGRASYSRTIRIPSSWKGKAVTLFLERAHWVTEVWLDGSYIGKQDSLIAPHVYHLGTKLSPGAHRLKIRVDNTRKIDLGRFVSILYEGTQTNWNGLIGKLELRAQDPVAIEDVEVYPDVDRKLARVQVTIANAAGRPARGTIALSCAGHRVSVEFQSPSVTAEIPLGDRLRLWDEFSPALYDLTVTLKSPPYSDTRRVTFGMRKLATRGTQFTMNGRPLFLRGTLECGIFPLTGYPPADVESWRRIYRVIKSYGLNYMRFHSWCPPEAAFTAADMEGIMIQAEGPQANIAAGKDPERDAFIEREFKRIVHAYGNHPSFCLMTLGNEYGGPDELLSRWVGMLIKEDPRHLYSSASNAQTTANRQFTVSHRPRGVQGPGTAIDFRDAVSRQDRPLLGHEIGQWTFYPNFEEIKKYTGVLAARNFEVVRDDLEAKHMLDLAPRFFQATGKQAVLLYKEEIELLLRTPGHAGFALLDLHDYPGQGTALVGPLDPFWDSKGFVTPEQHRRYCSPTVPLLRMKKRTFTTAESFDGTAEVAHFGPHDLTGVRPEFRIEDEHGRTVASGSFPVLNVPTGQLTPLGEIHAALEQAPAPCKLTVTVSLAGTAARNDWEIWVYPSEPAPAPPPAVLVSHAWDTATKAVLTNGQRVVLLPKAVNSAESLPGKFLPVFWSPVWFPTQKPNTMGILCDPKHPVFAQFPTEFYSNWQWYDLIQDSRSVILDQTPAGFRPIVQVIDNFARNHKLGNLFEARVGRGRLIVCTLALSPESAAGSQFMKSLYAYAGSNAFNPAGELDLPLLDKLLTPGNLTAMQELGARVVYADSQQENHEAANILDGDPATLWHTAWGDHAAPFPHEVIVRFERPRQLSGVICLPRLDGNRNGWIKDYEVQLSDDGKSWCTAAHGQFDRSASRKRIAFTEPETASYLKFRALSSFDAQPFASLAELSVW